MHATGWYQSSLYRVDKLVPLHRTCSWVTRFHLATIFVIQHPQTGKLHELPSAVSKQQPLEIYDPVKVEPTQLVLLWDPVSEFKYTHTLKVCAYVCMFLCRDYWLLHWQDVDKIHSNWYTFTEVCKYWKLCESHGSHTFTLFTLPYPKYYIADFPWSARGSTNCKMHNSSMKCICAKFSDAQCVVDCTIMMKVCYHVTVTLKYNTSKQGVYYTSYYCNHIHYQWTTFSWNVVKAHLNLCMFSLVRLQVGVAITNGHVILKVWWVYPAVAPWRSLPEERPKLLQLIQGTQLIMTRLRYMKI